MRNTPCLVAHLSPVNPGSTASSSPLSLPSCLEASFGFHLGTPGVWNPQRSGIPFRGPRCCFLLTSAFSSGLLQHRGGRGEALGIRGACISVISFRFGRFEQQRPCHSKPLGPVGMHLVNSASYTALHGHFAFVPEGGIFWAWNSD